MFCVIKTNVWRGISNSYMTRRYTFLWIFRKNCINNISSKSQKRQRLIAFIFVNTVQYTRTLKRNIYHSNKRVPPPFFHSYINLVFAHVLIHYFDKTHVLVVTVELIWLLLLNMLSFNVFPKPNEFLLSWQDSEETLQSALSF